MYTEISEILKKEINRQNNTIELIASENFASDSVMKLCGSVFTNKYAEGYPGNRFYNGCEFMDEIESLAIDQLKKIYKCNYSNVQPHSGANANTAIYNAFLKPGDRILGMDLSSGGHLSHGSSVNISGKIYQSFHYGVDKDGWLDMDQVYELAQQVRPQMLIAGASAYPRKIDFERFRKIADSVGCYLLVDMAHYSGLVAGGVYPSPVEHADFVTSTTHKTLRGPRGGIILWNDSSFTKKINSSVFPGTQGGPLMNIVAAKAQAFLEASTDSFREYSEQVIKNAKEMAMVFENRGLKVVTNGTDSHIVLLDLTQTKYNGKQAADILEKNNITVNKNSIPNDTRNFIETSGIRIGTAAETTRGHDQKWFNSLAHTISDLILN